MKKNLLVAAVVLLAAGCAKVTTVDTAEPQEIKLEGYTYAVTKAPIANGATLSGTYDMLVHAIHVNDNGESSEYFTNNGVTFKEQSGSTKKWAGTTPQYWPSEGTLTFNAISPVTISPDKTILEKTSTSFFTYADGAVSEIKATLKDNSTNQADVLVAKTVAGQNKTDNALGVNMTFYHALAQIVVTAKTGDDAPTTKINSIKLNNTAQAGTLSATNLSNENGPAFKWTASGYTVTGIDFNGGFINGSNLTTTESDESIGILVLPVDEKDATTKYSITVNYNLGSNTGLESTLELLSADTGKISKWEAGKKYVYNLTITATQILIVPSVDNWDDPATEDDVTVGE